MERLKAAAVLTIGATWCAILMAGIIHLGILPWLSGLKMMFGN